MKLKEILALIGVTALALLLVFKFAPKKKKPIIVPKPPVPPVVPDDSPTPIPHPREPVNTAATMGNTDVKPVIVKWILDWNVADPAYWINHVTIALSEAKPYPAWCEYWDNAVYMQPPYCNPGTNGHECAHIVWFNELSRKQRNEFKAVYLPLMSISPIKELYGWNPYGISKVSEGYAEIYRYLGHSMPEELKRFYPKLI